MAVFSIRNGDIAPAPGARVSDEVADRVLSTLHTRAVELVSMSLLPVGYVDGTEGERQPLLALDPSGQTVLVEVTRVVTSASLLASLARAGEFATISYERAERLYSGESLERDWERFHASNGPVVRPGARLYVLALEIEPDVLSVARSLAGGGVEIHIARVLEGGAEPIISLEQIHADGGLLARLGRAPEPAGVESLAEPAPAQSESVSEEPVAEPGAQPAETEPVDGDDEAERLEVAATVEAGMPTVEEPEAAEEPEAESVPEPKPQREPAPEPEPEPERAPHHFSHRFRPEWRSMRETPSPASASEPPARRPSEATTTQFVSPLYAPRTRSETAARLRALAARVDTPLELEFVFLRRGIDERATLTDAGEIELADGRRFSDPTEAVEAVSELHNPDGWSLWRTADGRTLGKL